MSINNDIFMVDSHCHLNYEGISHRVDEVISNAHNAGVKLMQTICTKLHEFEDIYKIAEANNTVYASVGIHPHEAGLITANHDFANLPETLLKYADRPKTIGIGESGLDYHYNDISIAKQKESFMIHMEAASQTGLPLIIHTRDAENDTYQMLKDFMATKPLKPLLHCFTGSADLAKKALEIGAYISISGIITFKNAEDLRNIVKSIIPLDRLLVETDAPFLAPMPYRGKICEPAYTRNTAEFIAELKGISLAELASATTGNFLKLFSKVKL